MGLPLLVTRDKTLFCPVSLEEISLAWPIGGSLILFLLSPVCSIGRKWMAWKTSACIQKEEWRKKYRAVLRTALQILNRIKGAKDYSCWIGGRVGQTAAGHEPIASPNQVYLVLGREQKPTRLSTPLVPSSSLVRYRTTLPASHPTTSFRDEDKCAQEERMKTSCSFPLPFLDR